MKWEQRYCKLPVSFLTVKLKLGPNFSQFIHRFKYNYEYNLNMGLSVDLMLYFQIFPSSRKRSLYSQIVTNSVRSWEIRSLKSPRFLFIRSQIIWSLKLAKTFSQQSMAQFIPMLQIFSIWENWFLNKQIDKNLVILQTVKLIICLIKFQDIH